MLAVLGPQGVKCHLLQQLAGKILWGCSGDIVGCSC